jgi:hypothetical protein
MDRWMPIAIPVDIVSPLADPGRITSPGDDIEQFIRVLRRGHAGSSPLPETKRAAGFSAARWFT